MLHTFVINLCNNLIKQRGKFNHPNISSCINLILIALYWLKHININTENNFGTLSLIASLTYPMFTSKAIWIGGYKVVERFSDYQQSNCDQTIVGEKRGNIQFPAKREQMGCLKVFQIHHIWH